MKPSLSAQASNCELKAWTLVAKAEISAEMKASSKRTASRDGLVLMYVAAQAAGDGSDSRDSVEVRSRARKMLQQEEEGTTTEGDGQANPTQEADQVRAYHGRRAMGRASEKVRGLQQGGCTCEKPIHEA